MEKELQRSLGTTAEEYKAQKKIKWKLNFEVNTL